MAANQTTQQAPNKRFRMFDTAESAALWFNIFNVVLLLGAFLVLVGTWGAFKTGAIKELFSDERVAANEAETARANESSELLKKETARLSAEAEAARKETASAQLQLEQMRFPRSLNFDKFKADIAGIPPQFFEVLYDQSAGDAQSLAFNIFVSMLGLGWRTDQKLPAPLTPKPGPPELHDVWQLLPLSQQSGGQQWGVSVVTKGPITNDPKSLQGVLVRSLLYAVSSPVPTIGGGKDETMPEGKIRIIVGPKLP